MKIRVFILVLMYGSVAWSQQLEFQYSNQQLNVYNSLTNDIPLFTQNFDDQVSAAIPFTPFTMGGQAYNTLFVSTNGFLTLGQAASSNNYNPISQPPGMPVIAPFACNLESANNNARISYAIVTGFNNVPLYIIVQWSNVRRVGMQGESFSFQAKLNFTAVISPGIEFIYGDFSSTNVTQTAVEIGIRVGTGNTSSEFQNLQVNNGGTWVPQQFGTNVNSTCLFPSATGAAGVPPSGMTHQWFLLYNNFQPDTNSSPICNQDGNVVIYSNYDGGTLNINCDQNIPNLKIGICTYEPVIVNINGPFVGNITEVLYAGFNSNQNNNNCGLGNFTTSISGVNPSLVQILTAPPLEYSPTHQNGQAFTSSLMVGVSGQCDTIYYAGGGNTPDEVVAYFLNAFNGDLRFHHTQYNCWLSEIYDLSDGGTCCTDPFVTIPDWQISISNDTSVCFGENVSPALLSNTGGIAPFTYEWSFNGNVVSTVEQFTFSPTQSGTACLTVTDANGDTLSECLNIIVAPQVNPQLSFLETDLCWPESFSVINETNQNTFTSQTWLVNDVPYPGEEIFVFSPSQPGTYSVELQLTNSLGCVYDTLVSNALLSLPSPEADFSATPTIVEVDNPLVSFTDQSSGEISSWNWTFYVPPSGETSAEQNPQFSFPNDVGGAYVVELIVSNSNGCTDTIVGTITVIENYTLFVPNSFSPDGNEFNNVFKVSGYGIDLFSFRLEIYNRWGEIIFVSNDPEIGWDGSYGDSRKMAPIGAYTYKLNYKLKNQEQPNVISGHVNLIR
ncbi:MAG: gliding motility-associated C-terminal domain-containing protein [Flavobacteriia bacterium]